MDYDNKSQAGLGALPFHWAGVLRGGGGGHFTMTLILSTLIPGVTARKTVLPLTLRLSLAVHPLSVLCNIRQ